MLVPKSEELVATPHRFGGDQSKAERHFLKGLGEAFHLMRSRSNPDYRHVLNGARLWASVVALAAIVAIALVSVTTRETETAEAQLPPRIEAIIFHGKVTIQGEAPAYAGFEITARIGDWESPGVIVGARSDRPQNFEHLVVAPPSELDLAGSQIEFWLDGQVVSTVFNYYAQINEFTGEICPGCTWSFPILREVNLDFPSLPEATPTPTLSPTPSPVFLRPRVL